MATAQDQSVWSDEPCFHEIPITKRPMGTTTKQDNQHSAAYTHAQAKAFRVAAGAALAGILISMLRFTKAQE